MVVTSHKIENFDFEDQMLKYFSYNPDKKSFVIKITIFIKVPFN
jgi:hypothetical protein